jgi:predicted membrane-bound spermidine synthase
VIPFLFAGLMVGRALAGDAASAHRAYAANLAGSAGGCLLVVLLPPALGGERTVAFAAWLGTLAGLALLLGRPGAGRRAGAQAIRLAQVAACLLLALVWLRPPAWLGLRLSPYKPLAQALLYPGARVVQQRWSASARADLVESAGIRSLPGLSYVYPGVPPPQAGLALDGDALAPITRVPSPAGLQPPAAGYDFAAYLPERLAFDLRPGADVLVIEPGGGLDVLAALASGAGRVTVVHGEPLAAEVVAEAAGTLYHDPRVRVIAEPARTFLARSDERFDVALLALADPYRPVTSGAYSLAETYLLTEEAVGAYLDHLRPEGLLVMGRWLQSAPSEELRAYATILAALDRRGADPERAVIALRSFQTATFFVQPGGFAEAEIEAARDFAESRRFDLMALPGLRPEETNRFNVLPEPIYSAAFAGLRTAADRQAFYAAYPFDVRPPTDDRPFFFHFFKWSQTPATLQTLGRTWQPFGGSGYFVLLALLALATALAGLLISVPLIVYRLHRACGAGAVRVSPVARRPAQASYALRFRHFAPYFASLGFGFLLVEIPLVQRYILFLGQPIYALAAVLGGLLAFSGIGSLLSRRLPLWPALAGIALLALGYPALTRWLFGAAAGLPLEARIGVAILSLAPLGLLMGVPFAAGLARIAARPEGREAIPLAWAVNGATSVVGGVLAAILALSFGFSAVLALGAAAYGAAVPSVPPTSGTKDTSSTR